MIRRRSSVLIALVLGLLAAGALYAVLSERRLRGEVPGRGAILSLAVANDRFLVATSVGLFESKDAIDWQRHEFTGRIQVASSGQAVFATVGPRIFRLDNNASGGLLRSTPSALAVEAEGLYAAVLGFIHTPDGDVQMHDPQPTDVAALDVEPPVFYAGGISSGLWKSENSGQNWRQLLETPITAILADSGRIFVGTPGALLISEAPDRLEFTELREPIGGLAKVDGRFYAVASRVIYRSDNGKTNWRAVTP